MTTNANSPAMPVAYITEYPTSIGYEKRDEVHFGLTKKEHFALEIAKAYLSNSWQAKTLDALGDSSRQQMQTVADISCVMADILLARLERTK